MKEVKREQKDERKERKKKISREHVGQANQFLG
jgi:hypothetical protein